MATLSKTKQEFDPECIRCHATGTTARHGFTNAADTPELVNVQCEACHGPALAHTKSPAKGFGKANEETCRACHTTERAPDFDYDIAWAKIMH
jgi:mono/diheme cytochrome c family protein